MKRFAFTLFALLLCVTLVLPAYASGGFAPSIGDKDEPDFTLPSIPDECEILVTSVADALAVPDGIREPFHNELIDVYNQIVGGTMTLPIPDDMVVQDLFDISYVCDDYHDESNVDLGFSFDVGADANDEVKVFVYHGGQWVEMPVTNFGDGEIFVNFSMISPVAICVKEVPNPSTDPSVPSDPGTTTTPTTPTKPGGSPETGDTAQILLWAVLLLASFAAVILLLLGKRSKSKKRG